MIKKKSHHQDHQFHLINLASRYYCVDLYYYLYILVVDLCIAPIGAG